MDEANAKSNAGHSGTAIDIERLIELRESTLKTIGTIQQLQAESASQRRRNEFIIRRKNALLNKQLSQQQAKSIQNGQP